MRSTNTNVLENLTEADRAVAGAPLAGPHPKKPGVLIVDDEHLVRVLIQLGLERNGFYVWAAASGQEALDLYKKNRDHVAVVLLDIRMPEMDGPQTMDALKALAPDLPVCFMSGNMGEYDPEMLSQRGAACFVPKPFYMDELAEIVRVLAEGGSTDLYPLGRESQ